MPSITVRDVPEDVHRTLSVRAAAERRSLQEYLRGELVALAQTPSRDEWLARVREHRRLGTTLTTAQILDAIHSERR